MTLRDIWRRLAPARYTRALESEVDRLRAENRALLNSILGIAGIPPIPVTTDSVLAGQQHIDPKEDSGSNRASSLENQPGRKAKTGAGKRPSRDPNSVGRTMTAPMRRRSWHQINRMLEFESAKRAISEP